MSNKHRITFIGLGVMGYPMAGHLCNSGHIVTTFNRTTSRAVEWSKEYNGQHNNDLASACKSADFVITCIGNDEDLRSVYFGPKGILQNGAEKTVFIDHTTASASVAREINEAATLNGQSFLDAPVSGGEQGAINGRLAIMCGGSESTFNASKAILNSYALFCQLMGPSGSGQLTKMVNQIAIAGLIEGLAESINFAQLAGLDTQQVIDVISKGAAQSWQMENRHKTMINGEYNHGFAVDLMRKDLAICLAEARHIGATLPITAIVDQLYGEIQTMGGGRWDTSSLLARLKKTTK